MPRKKIKTESEAITEIVSNDQLGVIKLVNERELPDGGADYTFEYDKVFENTVKRNLGVKRVTKKQIGDYLLKLITEAAERTVAERDAKKKTSK